MAKIFAVNTGSSSLKFKIYEMPKEVVLCSGLAERIGHDNAIFTLKDGDGNKIDVIESPLKDHTDAVQLVIKKLLEHKLLNNMSEIDGVGHRIVQGGKYFKDSAVLDEKTIEIISDLASLAPLHNPAHILGYNAFKTLLPNTPMVAVFDTAFHQTMKAEDYTFAIPKEYAKKYDIRRYGFHGTSHKYLMEIATKRYLQNTKQKRIITCHLGSGVSIAAINKGKCVATSMGLTPLGGIMMGTRTGDMDPSVLWFLAKALNKSTDEVYDILNKKSGFLGVSGVSNDARDVIDAMEQGNKDAKLADALFVRRVVDFIGQYYVRLGGCDAIIFSAGIGENDGRYRELICKALEKPLGIKIDTELNRPLRGVEKLISTPKSKVKVIIIPTDEEVMIARDTYRIALKG